MIGLGSNRLTVCRRGGMSVTQAGKGGMEWLAGYREPSWANPYSGQATAALKAQFPTQWPTIRDYGFAHPALVPFINEDPMLVMSLIEGLGTRWIDNNGYAFIWTDIILNQNSRVVCDYKILSRANNISGNLWGSETRWESNMFTLAWDTNQYIYVCYNNSWRNTSESATSTDICRCDANKNVWTIRNLTKGTTIISNTFSAVSSISAGCGMGIFLCQLPTSGSSYSNERYHFSLNYLDVYDNGTLTHQFVPCKHIDNGVLKCGMLDLIDLRWYGDSNQATGVATFTISESPS